MKKSPTSGLCLRILRVNLAFWWPAPINIIQPSSSRSGFVDGKNSGTFKYITVESEHSVWIWIGLYSPLNCLTTQELINSNFFIFTLKLSM